MTFTDIDMSQELKSKKHHSHTNTGIGMLLFQNRYFGPRASLDHGHTKPRHASAKCGSPQVAAEKLAAMLATNLPQSTCTKRHAMGGKRHGRILWLPKVKNRTKQLPRLVWLPNFTHGELWP